MQKILVPIILLCVLGGLTSVHAQQDVQFTQYMFNYLYYNPAYSGVEGVTKVTAMHRSQWAGYTPTFSDGGAPATQMVSFTTPVLRYRSGVGAYIINENLGALQNMEAQVSYAYHIGVEKAKLSFGIRAGAFSQVIDFDQYRPIDEDDPLLADKSGQESQIRPDLAVGVHYQSEKFYAGIGANHIINSEFDFGVNQLRNRLEPHLNLSFGYYYDFNYNLLLIPSFLVRTDLNTYNFEVGVLGTYDDKYWGGLSFRQGESANVMLGIALLKENALRIGYGFDYVIKAQGAKSPTSHEVMLSYTLPAISSAGRKIQRNPRFRHN
ncbi:type IX secretion system membrane protein PorP/SprF [Roseivirga sp. BDSF3-8]|uniref:PorP/SprF family type IX secretion system membrane protein n=1 Tax=Roseivirga sp. BDSF3-8 TaxID=3241598 RepID=UPI003531AE52